MTSITLTAHDDPTLGSVTWQALVALDAIAAELAGEHHQTAEAITACVDAIRQHASPADPERVAQQQAWAAQRMENWRRALEGPADDPGPGATVIRFRTKPTTDPEESHR